MNYSKITTIIDLITIEVSCEFFENLLKSCFQICCYIFAPHCIQ
jgi:hypothetical protein